MTADAEWLAAQLLVALVAKDAQRLNEGPFRAGMEMACEEIIERMKAEPGAARREELHDDDCSLGKHGHPYESVCDCGRDRGEGLCRGCHGNGTITIRESGSSRAIGVSVCPACNGRGEIADPPLTPTGKLALHVAERALTEERRMRVQLSDDSQRHLDRALAAERALALAREALERIARECDGPAYAIARALLAPPEGGNSPA
jgi:hypothetical protein